MICPKCGFEQGEGVECVRCGVIFARFRAPSQRPAPAPFAVPAQVVAPPPLPPPPPPPEAPAIPAAPEAAPLDPGPPVAEPPEAQDAPRPPTMFDPHPVTVAPRVVLTRRPQPVSGSELLRESISILTMNFLPFCLLAGLALLPSFVAGFLYPEQAGYVLFFSLLFCQPLATGAVTFGVFNQMRGRDVSLGACLKVGISSFGRVLLAGLVQGFWVFGLVVLISVPMIALGSAVFATNRLAGGILFALAAILAVHRYFVTIVKLSVVIPASIEERLGPIEASRRSTELTDGNRGAILHALFFLGALALILQFGTQLIFQHVFHVHEALGFASTLVSVVTTALAATAGAVIYYRLRGFEESVDIDQITSVFG